MNENGPGPSIPPPAGWYQDPQSGSPRWWDGTRWGPVAAAPPSNNADTNLALSVLGHLGFLMLPVVLPLVFYLTVGTTDLQARRHAREALNFQITFLIVWLACGFILFVTMFGAAMRQTDPPAVFFALFFGMFALYFVGLGLSIAGAVQAGRRRTWRYPVSLRLVGRHER